MLAIEAVSVTLANDVQSWKAATSMTVTDVGMATLVNDVQSWKAAPSMLVTDE